MGCRVEISSTVVHHGGQEDSLLHRGPLHYRLPEKFCYSTWSNYTFSLVSVGLFCWFSLHSPSCCSTAVFFFPLLNFFFPKSVLPEAQPVSLTGSALAGSRNLLEPALV